MIAGAGNNNRLHLWDAKSGRLICMFPDTSAITCVAMTGDGVNVVAGSADGNVYFWDVVKGALTRRVRVTKDEVPIAAIALAPDGNIMVVNDGTILHFWSLERSAELGRIENLDLSVGHTIDFSPDSRIFAAVEYEGNIHLWDGRTTKKLRMIRHERGITGVAFSPDGINIGAVGLQSVGVWEVATGRPVTIFPFAGSAYCLCFSPNGRILAAGGENGSLLVWSLDSNRRIRALKARDRIRTLAFSPDGKVLAAGAERVIRLWEIESGNAIGLYPVHSLRIDDLAVHPHVNAIATASVDKTIRLWQADTGRPLRTVPVPQDEFFAIALGRTKNVAVTGDRRGVVRFWNLDSGKEAWRLTGKPEIINRVILSVDGKHVASVAVGDRATDTACFWDISAADRGVPLFSQEDGVCSVCFSSDSNKVVVGRSDGSIILRDLRTGRDLRRFFINGDVILAVTLSDDGNLLAAGGYDGRVRVWNMTDEKAPSQSPPWDDPEDHVIRAVAISPEGKYVAYGGDDQVVSIMNVTSGKVIRQMEGHAGYITVLRYFDDGKRLASASDDGTALVWDVSNAQ
jgi:WD40 repeat protein